MARLLFPNEGDRAAYGINNATSAWQSAAGTLVTVWADSGATVLADITDLASVPISGSQVTVDTDSLIPQFLGPDGDVRVLYVTSSNLSTPTPIYAAETDLAVPAFAVVTGNTFFVARKLSDGSVISSNADLLTVVNAALDAAFNNGGGRVLCKWDGPKNLVSPGLTMKRGVQLVGAGCSLDRPNSNTIRGTSFVASGTWSADQNMITVGALGPTGSAAGCMITDIGFNAASKDINIINGKNAQDLKVERCVLYGADQSTRKAIKIESDQATNSGSGAEPRIQRNWIRSCYHAIHILGTGATDGHIESNDIWTCIKHIEIHQGGWQVANNHIVGNTSTLFQIFTDSSNTQILNNYLDSVGNGQWIVELATGAVRCLVQGNFFLTSGNSTTIGVKFTAQRNAVIGNSFATSGGAFLKFTNAGNGGTIVGNSGDGPAAGHTLEDSTGTARPDANGAGFYYIANLII